MMIGWGDLYKVLEAMVPLYVILLTGYGAWLCGPFGMEAHVTFSKLLYYFVFPFFTFELTSHIDPFHFNITFLLADFISKFLILVSLFLWATRCPNGSYDWSITCFSLSSLTNSLIIGVPFIQVMYGQMGVDLVVQGSTCQAIFWLTGLLFILEHRRVRLEFSNAAQNRAMDIEGSPSSSSSSNNRPYFNPALMKSVLFKLAKNPNCYACIIGLCWAFLAKRRHIQMPRIVENSVGIMSNMGTGTAMLNMGIFIGLQDNWIACGARQALIGMVLKFIAGPVAMAIGSFVMRLHGDVLRVAILQAAIPLSITSFIYAREYDLHAEVLSTALIIGTIFSLPVLVAAYYALLKFA